MLKISLQKLPESHFGCSFWLLVAGASRHKPGNPWFEQLLMRKHEVFHDLTNFTPKNSRIFARAALISSFYKQFLRVTSILTGFLRGSLHPRSAPRFRHPSMPLLIQNRKNPTGSSCFGSPVWGIAICTTCVHGNGETWLGIGSFMA